MDCPECKGEGCDDCDWEGKVCETCYEPYAFCDCDDDEIERGSEDAADAE